MAVRKIERAEWRAYFDAFSRPLARGARTEYAEIRVFSPDIGAQPETRWLPLRGIAYDERHDLLDVAVEHMDHRILHPREIYVDEGPGGEVLCSMEVVEQDGTREVIELR